MDLLRRSLGDPNGCSGYSQPACEITDPVSTAILTEIEKTYLYERHIVELYRADGCWNTAKPTTSAVTISLFV